MGKVRPYTVLVYVPSICPMYSMYRVQPRLISKTSDIYKLECLHSKLMIPYSIYKLITHPRHLTKRKRKIETKKEREKEVFVRRISTYD